MTYVFPKTLAPLREYLRGQGADVKSFVSARQAAFIAQRLLDTRVRFPPQGQDMTSTLLQIQQLVPNDAKPVVKPLQKPTKAKLARTSKHRVDFTADMFAIGVHVFCDGAAVPNPGAGGWGVVVYLDGVEVEALSGGDPVTTNNRMEMGALLVAIQTAKRINGPTTVWSDSKYCVDGVNSWRHQWKRHGWRKTPNAKERVKNADLWQAIDEALEDMLVSERISVSWVKGHSGILGNERADELAEVGRQAACDEAAA